MKKLLNIFLALMLVLAVTGCGGVGEDQPGGTAVVTDGAVIGEGAVTFQAQIVDLEGTSVSFTVKTDEDTVGEALQTLGVLEGEEGPYGLYIKAVNGVPLDYEKDGAYWAFYVDDAYAVTGVDETPIVESSVYRLQAEKG